MPLKLAGTATSLVEQPDKRLAGNGWMWLARNWCPTDWMWRAGNGDIPGWNGWLEAGPGNGENRRLSDPCG
ncbi:hypothetical protein [Kibdelosporangium philippinense]|uniref:hypothetical protein n=1 Tax=Kibdelosporangium philippinense TaxID=211113 RepID=UPI003607B625